MPKSACLGICGLQHPLNLSTIITTGKHLTDHVNFQVTHFFLGILFGYFLISPLCVQFFGGYKLTAEVQNNFTISSYMSMITTSTFFSGLFFELPVVIYILSKLKVVTSSFLKKYRKHALIAILLLSAIITPPDVISQILVSFQFHNFHN